MRKTGLILDCDGTLMDTIGAWHEAEKALLAEAGVTLTKEQRDELNALTLEEAGAFFHEHFGIRTDSAEVVKAILEYLLEFYKTRAEATPGACEFVKSAHEAGFVTSVLSSSPQEFLQVGLARGGFMPYLDHIVSVEDLDVTKRDTEAYDHMCNVLGTAPSDTWFFDDSWYAVATAREAGLRTVGVFSSDNCGTHEELARYCDKVIDEFTEISVSDFIG